MEKPILRSVDRLYRKLGRPVCMADLKPALGIRGTNTTASRGDNQGRKTLNMALRRLYTQGKLARSASLVRVTGYPDSSYASRRRRNGVTSVYFYAPLSTAGNWANFEYNGQGHSVQLVTPATETDPETPKVVKKPLVAQLLQETERALTTSEVLDRLAERHGLHHDIVERRKLHMASGGKVPEKEWVEAKRAYYNATSSILRAVLKPLLRSGLRCLRVSNSWVWYYTDEQRARYIEHLVESDPFLRATKARLEAETCVSMTELASTLDFSLEEARYRVSTYGTRFRVEIKTVAGEEGDRLELSPPQEVSKGVLPWLGYVLVREPERPNGSGRRRPHGAGFSTFLIHVGAEWGEALRREVEKNRQQIPERALRGIFYERLVQRLFHHLCTSDLLSRAGLSRYMIPFEFRDKVTNVWFTRDSGRRAEFDVLIRGTFSAFDAMTQGQPWLDIAIPLETKYTTVTTEHVAHFHEKIKHHVAQPTVFPIIIGLNWEQEARSLARHYGIRCIYFEALNKLIQAMTGGKYRTEHEWKRVDGWFKDGTHTRESLREALDSQKIEFLFEEEIQKRASEERAPLPTPTPVES